MQVWSFAHRILPIDCSHGLLAIGNKIKSLLLLETVYLKGKRTFGNKFVLKERCPDHPY